MMHRLIFLPLAALFPIMLGGCSDEDPSIGDQAPPFNAASAKRMTADDLMDRFHNRESAENEKMVGASIILIGSLNAIQPSMISPQVKFRARDDDTVSADFDSPDLIDNLNVGETVELHCVGADSYFGDIAVHNCTVAYHGPRRARDPV